MSLQKELDKLNAQYDKAATKLLSEARAKYVIPFCDKHSLKFVAGMGTWCFWKNGDLWKGEQIWGDDKEDMPKRLLAVLDAEMHNCPNSAGSLMEDYTSPTYQDKAR